MSKVQALDVAAPGEIGRRTRKAIPLPGKIFSLLCIPLVGVAVYYAPALTALGWHVVHGNAVEYRGLRVQVPLGWTADMNQAGDDFQANPQGVTLQKPPKTLNLEARGPELIYVNLLLPDARSTPQQQAEEWKSLFRQSHPTSDFNVAAPADLPSGIDCLEATPRSISRDMPAGAALACISLQEGWLANYAGTRGNVPLFEQIIGNLKPSAGNLKPSASPKS
jgi:hypothetical protein